MSQLFRIPSLPTAWPFPLRAQSREFTLRPLIEIPGLMGAWSLVTPTELVLGDSSETVGDAFGRGGLRRLGDVMLRPYRRGGLVRHFDESLYLNPSRFTDEFTVHRALWAAGFPTVEPLGYGYRRRLWGVEGVYLTRYEDARPWPTCWDEPEIMTRVWSLIQALCDWGLYAPDLNATNVLVAQNGQVLLLDWDRANWTPGKNLMLRYHDRLYRSLKKLGAPPVVLQSIP